MTDTLTFTVYGVPATKGSKKGFAIRRGPKGAQQFTGKVAMIDDNKATLRDWTAAINAAVQAIAAEHATMDGPVAMTVLFVMPKPKSAPKRRRTWPDRKPGDIDKLLRALLDPLVKARVIEDDARIVSVLATKDYPEPGEHPRAEVTIRRVQEEVL